GQRERGEDEGRQEGRAHWPPETHGRPGAYSPPTLTCQRVAGAGARRAPPPRCPGGEGGGGAPGHGQGGGGKGRRALLPLLLGLPSLAKAQGADVKIVKQDITIDGADPGVKLFVRSKMAAGAKPSANNVVVFVHGATFPSTPDFDLGFQDYSWADW